MLPIYYHVTGKGEWVDYNETKQGPVGPDHPFFWTNFRRTANHECLDCHATGLSVSYDPTSRTFATAFADPGVACECCHGPGGKHAASLDPKDVVPPGKVAPELGLAICAQCHGARLPHFPVLDAAHRYRPGQPYADAYDPIAVTDGSSFLSDFYADGRPRVGSDEYLALLQSRCYMKGGATCLTCHTPPHAEHQGPDELRLFPAAASIDPRDAACRGCHADLFLRLDAHTHHRAREARTCVACHMPPVVSGVLDQLADHAIDVPAPGTTIRHGVPNACNACHEQATPQEMEAALYRLWPDAARRTERRRRLADAFDVATAATSESSLEAVLADGSEAETLRAAAASLLASRIKERAREPLLAALSDPSPLVRSAAASGLSWAGPGVAPSLRPLLADPSTAVELAAAATLIASDDPEAEALYRRLAGAPATSGLVDPHIQLGLLDARRQRLAEAETELRTAIDLQFYNTYALVKLADVYMVTGRRQLAEATANEALRFDPQDREARKRLGR
ncbi:MAG: HEAT repeat domain-containing protein [Acidobacteriota bacterium]